MPWFTFASTSKNSAVQLNCIRRRSLRMTCTLSSIAGNCLFVLVNFHQMTAFSLRSSSSMVHFVILAFVLCAILQLFCSWACVCCALKLQLNNCCVMMAIGSQFNATTWLQYFNILFFDSYFKPYFTYFRRLNHYTEYLRNLSSNDQYFDHFFFINKSLSG